MAAPSGALTCQVLRLLGVGAMSRVYEAVMPASGQRVALKVLREEHADRRDLVLRFLGEARPILELDLHHPGLPRVFACGTEEAPYLVLELLGPSLRQRLRQGALRVREAVSISAQLAAALAAVHNRGVVHRDVKPDNVLFALDDPMHVKLVDFGLAKHIVPAPGPQVSTTEGVGMGTAEYMAPEQSQDAKHVGDRADVYALGVVLYELLAGHPPFSGDTAGKLRVQHAMAPPRPLTDPALPAELWPLCVRMLAKQPTERPGAAEVAAALARIAG